MLGGTMRTLLRRLVVTAVALLTATTALPAVAADSHEPREHPSHGDLSAVIRCTR